MTAVLSWSSGKDAAWALHQVRSQGIQIAGLWTTVDPEDRVQGHGVPVELVQAQAESLGLPLEVVRPSGPDNASYGAAVRESLRRMGAQQVYFGDLFLDDVRAFREEMLGREFQAHFPLWGCDTRKLVEAMVDGGINAVVVAVDTEQAPRELLGRTLRRSFLDELPSHVDPAGERGEFHTFVCSGPGFRRPLAPRWTDLQDDGRFVRVRLEPGSPRGFGTEPFELPPLEP